MPHITKTEQNSIVIGDMPSTPGQLTWKIYDSALRYIDLKGRSFSTFCVVIGALLCSALELYRLKVGPYEDEKIKSNGEAK